MNSPDELLAKIEAGLPGVTPGPWKFNPHYQISGGGWGKIADKPTPHRYTGATILSVGYKGQEVADYWVSIRDANAAHIAYCAPDNIAAIIGYVRGLEAENKRLREALRRYGDRTRMAWAPAELQDTIDAAMAESR